MADRQYDEDKDAFKTRSLPISYFALSPPVMQRKPKGLEHNLPGQVFRHCQNHHPPKMKGQKITMNLYQNIIFQSKSQERISNKKFAILRFSA
jgi:hypothetical protein